MRFVILILVAAIVSAIGFHKYVWFISLGYGFSITALGIGRHCVDVGGPS